MSVQIHYDNDKERGTVKTYESCASVIREVWCLLFWKPDKNQQKEMTFE
jgi:hypothetical protein